MSDNRTSDEPEFVTDLARRYFHYFHPASHTAVGDRESLRSAVGGVLFNAMNYPEAVQARMLGQDTEPLREKIIDAVLAAGFHRDNG